jgi:hypothetical protein
MTPSRLALSVAACLSLAPLAGRAEPFVAQYEIRAAGLAMLRAEVTIDLDGTQYRVISRMRSAGLGSVLSRSDSVTSVEGRWRGADPVPARYRMQGLWRGDQRTVAMDWASPGQPVVNRLEPEEPEREPVPEALRRGTVDTLSAMAKLARAVALTGRCEGSAAVYDGRRRTDIRAWTEGMERLPGSGPAAGEALRCGFESRLLAGARLDRDAEEARKPQLSTAWLGRPQPGLPAIPLRIDLPGRWFGGLRVVLTGVQRVPSGQEMAERRD